MHTFVIKLLDYSICVSANFLSTQKYCSEYLTSTYPSIYVELTKDDIEYERMRASHQEKLEGLPPHRYSDAYLEITAVQRKIAEELFHYDTLVFHGSVVAVDGQAYLFTAKSGTGKSTHTRLWREYFGDRAVMVNDDKVFLQMRQDSVWAYGSPWTGKHGIGNNISVPLKGICFLQRGTENKIQKATPEKWLPELIHQCFLPDEKYSTLVYRLALKIPLWEMSCTKAPEAATIAYEAMSK